LVRSGPAQARADALAALLATVRARPDAVTRELCLGLAEAGDGPTALDAVDVLGAMGDGAAAPRLLRLLARSRSPALRRRVVAALGVLKPSEASDAALLSRLRSDDDVAVRAEAAWALGKRRVAGAEGPLKEALRSTAPSLRGNAAAALLRNGWATAEVRALAQDRDPQARKNGELAVRGGRPTPGEDWVALTAVDYDGAPLADVPYLLTLPDGLVKAGRTDERGLAREERLPRGACQLELGGP
jgi:HEAT repeat protein